MPRKNTRQDFWDRVVKTETCWLWQGHTTNGGYGVFGIAGYHTTAHRFSYQWANGLIPEGLVIDHLCNVTRCVRPDHLKAVTQLENVHRSTSPTALNALKTHCPQGHPYSGDNLYVPPNGIGRQCRLCRVKYMDEYWLRMKK